MGLGIYMAASQNHGQHVTHAHILLVGFVVAIIYAVIHKLWLGNSGGRLPLVQFIFHQAGALAMAAGLLLLYGGVVPENQIEPLLSAASLSVFAAAVLMTIMAYKSR
jgi:hypothetical protein